MPQEERHAFILTHLQRHNGIRNGAELGALAAGGILVATLGARWTLLLAGGVSALAGLIGLAALPRVARGATGPEPADEPPATASV